MSWRRRGRLAAPRARAGLAPRAVLATAGGLALIETDGSVPPTMRGW